MLNNYLSSIYSTKANLAVVSLFAFFCTWILLSAKFNFLPKDHGREFAINGNLSKGKIRGVGLVMILSFLLIAMLFVPFSTEFLIYSALIVLEMISGYLDDASSIPWSDYKKGLIDLLVSIGISVVYLHYTSSVIRLGCTDLTINPILYGILSTILIWISINATNCSDGVDGLCGTVSVITLSSFTIIYGYCFDEKYTFYNLIMIFVILAYLLFNASPSSMLMGDAGSRAIGVFIALIAMKSLHPVSYILLALVLNVDGLAGLIKIFMKRFLKISILKTIRTPIHDHVRKNCGWSDTQVVIRFSIAQIILSFMLYIVNI